VAIVAAARKRRVSDYLIRGASLAALSTPPAFVALVLILIVAVRTGLLPAGGWGSGPLSDVPYLVLPVATLTVYLSPILVRVVRERAIVIFDEPYVEAAVARGVPRRSVVVRHVIPNCCGPLLTVLGSNFGALLSGSIITDVIFGLPGLGQVLTSAVASGDLPVLQGVALLSGILVTLANVCAEIGQRFVDPRLRA
jgi:peptide/nickel transport system permease protein